MLHDGRREVCPVSGLERRVTQHPEALVVHRARLIDVALDRPKAELLCSVLQVGRERTIGQAPDLGEQGVEEAPAGMARLLESGAFRWCQATAASVIDVGLWSILGRLHLPIVRACAVAPVDRAALFEPSGGLLVARLLRRAGHRVRFNAEPLEIFEG